MADWVVQLPFAEIAVVLGLVLLMLILCLQGVLALPNVQNVG